MPVDTKNPLDPLSILDIQGSRERISDSRNDRIEDSFIIPDLRAIRRAVKI